MCPVANCSLLNGVARNLFVALGFDTDGELDSVACDRGDVVTLTPASTFAASRTTTTTELPFIKVWDGGAFWLVIVLVRAVRGS